MRGYFGILGVGVGVASEWVEDRCGWERDGGDPSPHPKMKAKQRQDLSNLHQSSKRNHKFIKIKIRFSKLGLYFFAKLGSINSNQKWMR